MTKYSGNLSDIHEKFSIILCDPPWSYFGDSSKDQAAGKHYTLMDEEALSALPVKSIATKPCVLFMWATGPKLDQAFRVAEKWGFHYRGMAYIWIKTKKSDLSVPVGARGVRPSFVKPITEFVLVFSTNKKGRTFKLLTEKQKQLIFAPIAEHSRKPADVRERIVELLGDLPRIELFARESAPGWSSWGNEVDKFDNINTPTNTAQTISPTGESNGSNPETENTIGGVP